MVQASRLPEMLRLNEAGGTPAPQSRAIRYQPQWTDAYTARADCYDRLGEFRKAQADRDKAARIGGDSGT